MSSTGSGSELLARATPISAIGHVAYEKQVHITRVRAWLGQGRIVGKLRAYSSIAHGEFAWYDRPSPRKLTQIRQPPDKDHDTEENAKLEEIAGTARWYDGPE